MIVARAEVLSGMRHGERAVTTDLLARFPALAVEERIADVAAAYRRAYLASHQLTLPDALIAATAKVHKMKLATLNTRHFPMSDIQVERPY